MLHYSEIGNLVKPYLALDLTQTVLFLSLCILLIVSGEVSFSPIDDVVSQCSTYLNKKLSFYCEQIQLTTFFMTVLGFIFSLINLTFFLHFYLKARKKPSSLSENKPQYTSNKLKFSFILIFLQSICLINIALRSVEKLRELTVCDIESKTVFIVSIILCSLLFFAFIVSYCILIKFQELLNKKLETLQEYSLHSDRTSIRENLIFNQIGYVKRLFKLENFSSRSTSLKSEFIKGLPSGYKKQDFSPTREIIYKLYGGNKDHFEKSSNNENIFHQNMSHDDSLNNDENLSLERRKSEKQKEKVEEEKNLNLLNANFKNYQKTPNRENLKEITTTIDTLQVSLKMKEFNSKVESQNSDEHEEAPIVESILFKMTKVPTEDFKNQEKLKELKEEEELKQKFNLTPDIEARKKFQNHINWQNIDENGHYYHVNVEKIKNKTKFLSSNKITDDSNEIDPNLLYGDGQWVQRKKRVAKKHEKNVQEYLKNLSKLRKEEMLIEEEESSDESSDFEEDSISLEYFDDTESEDEDLNENEEKNEEQKINQKNQENQENIEDDKIQENTVEKPLKEKRKRKNLQPELYLHMRKKKHPPVENKLKLYEDEEGFYDDENDLEDSEGDPNLKVDAADVIEEIYERGLIREQSSEKYEKHQKQEEKLHLKNKELETEEAEMLKFIRKKYIESKENKIGESKIDNLGIVFEEIGESSSIKETTKK